jgi:predicted RNA binding protein YcfA (HicA-like mRNA interferase family)
MALLDANKTRQSLLKKGFIKNEGDHHFYLYFHNGKLVTKTKVSHNDQDIGDGLISKMYKQCKISKRQFFDLINCPLDQAGYENILKEQGLI